MGWLRLVTAATIGLLAGFFLGAHIVRKTMERDLYSLNRNLASFSISPERCAAIIDLIRDAPIKTDNSHGCPSFSFNKPPTMRDLAALRLFRQESFRLRPRRDLDHAAYPQ
jgi:hypothetical protein